MRNGLSVVSTVVLGVCHMSNRMNLPNPFRGVFVIFCSKKGLMSSRCTNQTMVSSDDLPMVVPDCCWVAVCFLMISGFDHTPLSHLLSALHDTRKPNVVCILWHTSSTCVEPTLASSQTPPPFRRDAECRAPPHTYSTLPPPQLAAHLPKPNARNQARIQRCAPAATIQA